MVKQVKSSAKVIAAPEQQNDENELNQDTLKLAESSSEEEDEEEGEADNFAGFESTDDESEEEEEKTEEKSQKQDTKSKQHHVVVKQSNKSDKYSTTLKNIEKHKRGLMYIGRLPKEFEENDLKRYFEQFGDISNAIIARNRKTGHSKHYGFIEFQQYSVAKVAQETMNNYTVFNHMLKCELIEPKNENAEMYLNLFNKSNKKFKKIPWGKIAKNKFEKSKTSNNWDKLKSKNDFKSKQRLERLKDAGFNF